MERLNIARFRIELANKDIDGGAKSLNEYQYNKMLIEILTKRNGVLEPSVKEYLMTQPDQRGDGGYGLSQVKTRKESKRIVNDLVRKHFEENDEDISEVEEIVPATTYISSTLRAEVAE